MNKTIGYVLAGVGVILAALSYPAVRNAIKIPNILIPDLWAMIIGVVLLLAGAFMAFKGSSSSQPKEIPIYEGHGKERKVVGIQRMGR